MYYLYIQGDKPNVWLPAQEWQKKFLNLNCSVKTFTNKNFRYEAFPFKDLDLDHVTKSTNIDDKNNIITINNGILKNQTTGMCRFYIFVRHPDEILTNYVHNGPRKFKPRTIVKRRKSSFFWLCCK